MQGIDWALIGGFLCGALAGGSARFGRLCTMSAIEDALVGGDFRGARGWGVAVIVAILATMALGSLGLVDVSASHYAQPKLHVLGVVVGGLVFGLGMTLVGTCSFGLIVRAGGGDLRAGVTAFIVGIAAFAVTAGVLAPARVVLLGFGNFDLRPFGGSTADGMLAAFVGLGPARAIIALLLVVVAGLLVADARVRQRHRLLLGGLGMGLAIAAGWLATSQAVADLGLARVESLSFVAPVGRLLAQAMMMPFRGVNFGVAAVVGVAVASFCVAALRRELRWEAFDDAIEMRRHLTGGALMGIGGVLAHGCTVGQGLSGASTLAISAPVFMISVLLGARTGLKYLIEGTALWRLGFSPRSGG